MERLFRSSNAARRLVEGPHGHRPGRLVALWRGQQEVGRVLHVCSGHSRCAAARRGPLAGAQSRLRGQWFGARRAVRPAIGSRGRLRVPRQRRLHRLCLVPVAPRRIPQVRPRDDLDVGLPIGDQRRGRDHRSCRPGVLPARRRRTRNSTSVARFRPAGARHRRRSPLGRPCRHRRQGRCHPHRARSANPGRAAPRRASSQRPARGSPRRSARIRAPRPAGLQPRRRSRFHLERRLQQFRQRRVAHHRRRSQRAELGSPTSAGRRTSPLARPAEPCPA
jgi:hypothetical protein